MDFQLEIESLERLEDLGSGKGGTVKLYSLKEMTFPKTQTDSLTFPKSIQMIHDYSFYNCSGFTIVLNQLENWPFISVLMLIKMN